MAIKLFIILLPPFSFLCSFYPNSLQYSNYNVEGVEKL